jgi:hypothetical protein
LKRLKDINIYLTYINSENEIEVISRKKLYIENKKNTITLNKLLDVIKKDQRRNNISYKLISIMVYNINVTPETLSDYIERPEDFISLFTLSRIDSFQLQSTISMLKEFNAMYFFFFEEPRRSTTSYPALPLPLPLSSSSLSESGEKGEKGEKSTEENHISETNVSVSVSASASKKPHNTTKRIYINNTPKNRNIKARNNKTKRYDKYVNLL